MLLFADAKLAFFSTPKTGSTAYHAILKRKADMVLSGKTSFKHITARHFDRFLAPYLAEAHELTPERVAVIREPIDHLGSWYRYRQRDEKKGKPNSTSGISFEEFVEAYLSTNRPSYANIGSQFRFVTSPKGEIRIHHLFAYARPELLRKFLEKRLKFDCETAKLNVSPQAELRISPAMESRLRERLAPDIELYERILKNGGHLVTKW